MLAGVLLIRFMRACCSRARASCVSRSCTYEVQQFASIAVSFSLQLITSELANSTRSKQTTVATRMISNTLAKMET